LEFFAIAASPFKIELIELIELIGPGHRVLAVLPFVGHRNVVGVSQLQCVDNVQEFVKALKLLLMLNPYPSATPHRGIALQIKVSATWVNVVHLAELVGSSSVDERRTCSAVLSRPAFLV
jgi:hypothetical protein